MVCTTKYSSEDVADTAESYTVADNLLKSTTGWYWLSDEQRQRIAEPLNSPTGSDVPVATLIPQPRSDIEARDKRLSDTVEEVRSLIQGPRIVQVRWDGISRAGSIPKNNLMPPLAHSGNECLHHIGLNKWILIQ